MVFPVIAVIGAGNMGASIVGGLIHHGYPPDHIWSSDPSEKKLDFLRQQFHIHTTLDNQVAIRSATVVIFAIKPQQFAQTALPLSTMIQAHTPLVISIVAGVREAHISNWLGKGIVIVRAVPNTPALIGCGAAALYANRFVTEKQRELAESILRAVGIAVWVDQELHLDTVTALSGSGPAYFFLVMESLQNAAEALGLPSDAARLLTLQTALGAARMAIESEVTLTELRCQVTSKGGTTERAISVLENNHIRTLFKRALEAAKLRSCELAQLIGDSE